MNSFNFDSFNDNLNEAKIFFDNNGYIIINNILNHDLINNLNQSVQVKGDRVQDYWKQNEYVKEVASNKDIFNILQNLYNDTPLPFQTLNFTKGTKQQEHVDLIHFSPSTDNLELMCGVWYAFEDITPEKGPLIFYPKSHKEKIILDLSNIGASNYSEYEIYMKNLATSKYTRTSALIPKGSCIIWKANLIHGGHPDCNKNTTRLSMVTHYFFKSSKYWWTPLISTPPKKKLLKNKWKNYFISIPQKKILRNNILELSKSIMN